MVMKSNIQQLKSRGYIEETELEKFRQLDKPQLMNLIQSKIPVERTISARLLARYKEEDVLKLLINSLVIEKKLYTKIALSEVISGYGEQASQLLIDYLGKVGNNQHRILSQKPFEKNNYPLPRDIIARTMCKIGKPALQALKYCVHHGEYSQKLEAIDAIGFITYYERDESLIEDMIELISIYEGDDLMTWKLLRALQSFNDERVVALLMRYQTSNIPQHKWEATRSIEQITRRKLSR